MDKDTSSTLGSVAKIIDAFRVNEQANSAGTISEKIIESLTELTIADKITADMFLEKIDNLSVNKKFRTLRGKMREIKIKLGDASEEK